jgi:hypothetical protein
MEQCKWLNVGMSEKLGIKSIYVAPPPNSSFTVNSLFKDLATVVHSIARHVSRIIDVHY